MIKVVSVWLASNRSETREPDKHEAQKRQADEGLAGARQPLIIAGQPPAPNEPGKGALDEPALGMDGQVGRPDPLRAKHAIHPYQARFRKGRSGWQRGFQHDQATSESLRNPAAQMPAIAAGGPDELSAGEAAAQRS
jgi:hypothetical protein